MMRRASCLVTATALVSSETQIRTFVPIKSKVEYRTPRLYPRKSAKEANEDRLKKEAVTMHPNPQSKKEALQHLLERPSYEYVTDYQRAANDMMAVHGTNWEHGADMQYNYHKIWRALKSSRIGADEGYAVESLRIAPGNQQL
eukprot:GILJ01031762.1.p1 GENE.GILJ01031762.1~~GILJ01031762.1.p1  ORF type:complete len:143 (+),score=22.18 GILJ01031762.1:3-431(+)